MKLQMQDWCTESQLQYQSACYTVNNLQHIYMKHPSRGQISGKMLNPADNCMLLWVFAVILISVQWNTQLARGHITVKKVSSCLQSVCHWPKSNCKQSYCSLPLLTLLSFTLTCNASFHITDRTTWLLEEKINWRKAPSDFSMLLCVLCTDVIGVKADVLSGVSYTSCRYLKVANSLGTLVNWLPSRYLRGEGRDPVLRIGAEWKAEVTLKWMTGWKENVSRDLSDSAHWTSDID